MYIVAELKLSMTDSTVNLHSIHKISLATYVAYLALIQVLMLRIFTPKKLCKVCEEFITSSKKKFCVIEEISFTERKTT